MYLVAIMDWYSRRVLSWRVSNTLDTDFCIEARRKLYSALKRRRSSIPTKGPSSPVNHRRLKDHAIAISMDGKGRWGTTCSSNVCGAGKYEDVYLRATKRPPASGRSGPLLRFLQHQAPSQRTGPTHPRCGVLDQAHRDLALKPEEDFTYHTVQFSGSISGMVIENSVPSGVRHRLAGHAQTARAAEEHAGGRHRGPLPPPGHAPALHRRPRRASPDQPVDGRTRRAATRLVAERAAGRRHAASQAGATADAGGGGPTARCFEPR